MWTCNSNSSMNWNEQTEWKHFCAVDICSSCMTLTSANLRWGLRRGLLQGIFVLSRYILGCYHTERQRESKHSFCHISQIWTLSADLETCHYPVDFSVWTIFGLLTGSLHISQAGFTLVLLPQPPQYLKCWFVLTQSVEFWVFSWWEQQNFMGVR